MIKKLYEKGYFDYKNFILDNLKSLSINSLEAIILIKILDNYKNSNTYNPLDLRSELSIRRDSFENALSNLVEKKMYEIYLTQENDISKEVISLDGFFERVEEIINDKQSFDVDEIHSIITYVTKEIGRILSSSEIDIITSLVEDDRYVKNDFINAIESINNSKRRLTIKTLSLELAKKDDKPKEKKETPSYVKDFIKSIK